VNDFLTQSVYAVTVRESQVLRAQTKFENH